MKVARKAVVSIAEIALLVVLVVVPSLWAFNQIKEAAAEQKHTFNVIHGANGLLSALIDAETGQRGYLLTGDKTLLEPYLAVRDGISGQLNTLRQISLIRAARQHLAALAPLIDAELAYLAHNIELRNNNNLTAALMNARGIQGKQMMDAIRAEMRRFIQIEEGALAQHDTEFQSKLRLLFIFIVTASPTSAV